MEIHSCRDINFNKKTKLDKYYRHQKKNHYHLDDMRN